ncbi:hypothetical protein LguiB_018641 [Lonicera macranthoides]
MQLILTEGDSTKALAMAEISLVGRNYYGVFRLRGELLNVRKANHKQIMENVEIQNLKRILGLQHDLERHKKDFIWVDDQDSDAIELAFSKKKIEARKNWLRQFETVFTLIRRKSLLSTA